jgi:hypothetical protein
MDARTSFTPRTKKGNRRTEMHADGSLASSPEIP